MEHSSRNFVSSNEHLIAYVDTSPSDSQLETIEKYNLKKIGYGYGVKNGTTKDLKNDYEFVITDWIAQSLHSLLIYEKDNLGKESDQYKLSKLARDLVDDDKLKIWKNAIKLT